MYVILQSFLDAVHGNVQQPAHNLVAVVNLSHFVPNLHHQNTDATGRDVTATCNHTPFRHVVYTQKCCSVKLPGLVVVKYSM